MVHCANSHGVRTRAWGEEACSGVKPATIEIWPAKNPGSVYRALKLTLMTLSMMVCYPYLVDEYLLVTINICIENGLDMLRSSQN